jgi:hypothetical protein
VALHAAVDGEARIYIRVHSQLIRAPQGHRDVRVRVQILQHSSELAEDFLRSLVPSAGQEGRSSENIWPSTLGKKHQFHHSGVELILGLLVDQWEVGIDLVQKLR